MSRNVGARRQSPERKVEYLDRSKLTGSLVRGDCSFLDLYIRCFTALVIGLEDEGDLRAWH